MLLTAARGSATQNILNSIMANRNNDMRSAMTNEDSRIPQYLGTDARRRRQLF